MKYDFNETILRKGYNSRKWDDVKELFGDDEILPMWIADMDFKVCPQIVEAITKRASHGIFGYATRSDSYYSALINWLEKRTSWKVNKDWITFSPGVLPALKLIIETYTKPGDKIICQPPVYPPIFETITESGRVLVENPLIYDNHKRKYYMDIEHFSSKIDSSVKLFILCNPHNPIGRVWGKEDLIKIGEKCLANNVVVVSDEIHCDLVLPGFKHIPFATLSDKLANNSITCLSPSKTFNLAGLQTANVIIPNKELREKYINTLNSYYLAKTNTFGIVALEAAYNYGEEWLNELILYLKDNLEYLKNFINHNIPQIKVVEPESTYLVWLDCRELGLDEKQLETFMLKKVKIAMDEGYIFGVEGKGFERINIACSRRTLEMALNRLNNAVKNLTKTGVPN